MADLSKIFANAILRGVEGGTQGYNKGKNLQQEYAIKKLSAKPSSALTYEYLESLPDIEKKADFLNTLAATSGYGYNIPKGGSRPVKSNLNPKIDKQTPTEEAFEAEKRRLRKKHPDWSEDKITVTAKRKI